MSTKPIRHFVIRGLSDISLPFDSLGVLSDKASFVEQTAPGVSSAYQRLYTLTFAALHGSYSKAINEVSKAFQDAEKELTGGRREQYDSMLKNIQSYSTRTGQSPDLGEDSEFIHLKFRLDLNSSTPDSKDGMKAVKSQIREATKAWAEKSRIYGCRGFRLSAIQEPTFEISKSTGLRYCTFDVILSTAVFYTNSTLMIVDTTTFIEKDIDVFKSFLKTGLGSFGKSLSTPNCFGSLSYTVQK